MKKLSAITIACLLTFNAQAVTLRYNYTLFDGQIPANWQKTDSEYGDWEDAGVVYRCTNWSPSVYSQGKGIIFTQTATDCQQDQKRWAQDYLRNNITGDKQKSGPQYEETRTITASDDREAVGALENWTSFTPTYTSWVDTNALYGCTAWTPNPSVYTATTNFTQTASCKTDQERLRQDREKELYTDEIRNVGEPVVEQQTLSNQSVSRLYAVTLGEWTDVGVAFGCTNWSPAVETIGKGITFTQNATDCRLDQTRTRAESYKDHKSGATVPVAKPNEGRTLNSQASSREATGTLENWMPTTPVYTAWTNISALNNCKVWTPAPSSKTSSTSFTQVASDCTTDQTRTRQDREMEQNTSEIRNKGVPVSESQTISNQVASRSYTVTLGAWANNGAKYACSNWSPAPSTVTIGQSFTQTATDCKQDQTRTRAESYVDHKTGSTVAVSVPGESQTLSNQTNTQTATGNKETWAAAAPTYTAWTNAGTAYNCSNWSPLGSSYSEATQFTQTATNCNLDQTRTRQDREQETTTLTYRNKGAAVTENQTLSNQSSARTYLEDFNAWTWSSEAYGCSNWSPDPATVNTGVTFTQTASNCSRNQTRGRAGYWWNSGVWTPDPASPYRTETQVIAGQSSSRTATGTKETWVAATPTYTAWVNSGSAYNCSNWAPLGSAYSERTQFTQTATNCNLNQTRTRQDREQETTTLAYRNKGTPVAESQTLSNQSSTRSYLEDFNDWTWNGDVYGCTNWSPDPSTVNSGVAFTQTASNCSRNQIRGRAGYWLNAGAWTADPASPYRTESRVIGSQTSSRTATGTKVTSQTLYDSYHMVRCTRTWGPTNACIFSWDGINNIGDLGVFDPTGRYIDVGGFRYTAGTLKSRYSDEDMDEDLYSITRTSL